MNGMFAAIAIGLVAICVMGIMSEREDTCRMEITNQIEMPSDSTITIQGHTYKLCEID